MKKLLLIAVAMLVLQGCFLDALWSDDDDDDAPPEDPTKIYRSVDV